MLEVIIYVIATIFIILRLYVVIGREESLHNQGFVGDSKEQNDSKIVEGSLVTEEVEKEAVLEKELEKNCSSEILQTLQELKKIDQNFALHNFFKGAEMAFEIIVKGFFAGEKKQIESLLSKDLYTKLSKRIDSRENTKYNFVLVSIKSKQIEDVVLQNNNASLKIKFVSEQIISIENGSDESNSDNNAVKTLEDIYIFERNLTSDDPNWSITSIQDV